jgi:hypothetical protein
LTTKGLSFFDAQKSSQEFENKGDRQNGKAKLENGRADRVR